MSDDLIRKFNAWDSAIQGSAQGDWRSEARDDFAMVAGHQVNDDDRRAAEDAGILYAVLNKIDSTVSAICGSEITNRQEVRYYPRQATIDSAQVNEVLTAAAEWSRDECDAADEESEAFRDAITCGMGWTETRMSYDVDPDGMPTTERVDPLEMAWDPSARRPNLADRRYQRRRRRFSKDEAAERFGIDTERYGSGRDKDGSDHSPHNADPEDAYRGRGDVDPPMRRDEIEITEYQWYDLEERVRYVDPTTGALDDVTPKEYERLAPILVSVAAQNGMPFQEGVTFRARVYWRAFRIADEIISGPERLPEEDFTLKCITGKLDRNKGIWYGVVRAMRDPQLLLNKQVTQLQRIIDVTAKGGLVAEKSAFEDPEQAKADWAASDSIVFAQDGALAAGRIIPKPVGQYPSAIDKMLGLTMELVPGVSGVNNEMLGVIDREQAGVVDWQRKQAAYGVLAGYFNSLRRYRREQGRLLLKLITKYMSDGRLVRIQGKLGDVRYVQLAKQKETIKYDVIVDEAPAGPNQKERTFLFLMQFAPVLKSLNIPPQIMMKFLEYTPLPASLISDIMQSVQSMPPQQDPKALEAQGKLQLQQQQMALDKLASDARLQLQAAEADATLTAKREEAALQLQLQRDRATEEARLARERVQSEEEIALIRLESEERIALRRIAIETRLEEERISSSERIGMKKADMNGTGISKHRPGGSLAE